MTDLQFVASIVNSLAWPAAVVVAAGLLRQHLAGLIQRTESIEGPGVRMTFAALSGYEKMIAAAEDETKARPEVIEFGFVETLTDDTPRQAIIGAWGLLEYELNIAADQLAPDQPHGWPQVARTLDAWDKWPLLYPAVMELRRLRDYTARSGQPPSSEDATRYVSVASELAATVRAAFTPASGDARSGAE